MGKELFFVSRVVLNWQRKTVSVWLWMKTKYFVSGADLFGLLPQRSAVTGCFVSRAGLNLQQQSSMVRLGVSVGMDFMLLMV